MPMQRNLEERLADIDILSLPSTLSITVVSDPENPAFDLEQFLTKLEQESK